MISSLKMDSIFDNSPRATKFRAKQMDSATALLDRAKRTKDADLVGLCKELLKVTGHNFVNNHDVKPTPQALFEAKKAYKDAEKKITTLFTELATTEERATAAEKRAIAAEKQIAALFAELAAAEERATTINERFAAFVGVERAAATAAEARAAVLAETLIEWQWQQLYDFAGATTLV